MLPQLHLVEKLPRFSAVAVHQGRSHSCPGAEADPHGPCDHGESTVAVRHGFLSLFCGCAAPQVQVVEVTVAVPQLHRVRHPRVVDIRVLAQRQFPLTLAVQQTTEILQLQFVDAVFDVPVVRLRGSGLFSA